MTRCNWIVVSLFALCFAAVAQTERRNISGIYPHLAMYNQHGECGTGAVVPWGGKLWVITYCPFGPGGSSDKLYVIDRELNQLVHRASVGGTPANRMIHRESQQLFIGPYAVDAKGNVRVIPPSRMPGRLTGNARHLTDPANMIYYATMEEGLYEVNVHTLAVKQFIVDNHSKKHTHPDSIRTVLPGHHGKGLYSGHGRVVYSNNGEKMGEEGASGTPHQIKTDPTIASGALAQWFGKGDWELVRRNQFTEVTGPGCIYGNPNPDKDPIWSVGWDYRSLILMLLEEGKWHAYRLPKSSHSYDGAHGWNTEWPRIRDIEEETLLMTMHGCFWHFPKTFGTQNSAGIKPRSNYLKVIGDFARWGDQVVVGCDDSAEKEFLNNRPFKSRKGAPGQSNSNLWFVTPSSLDTLGLVIGRGSVWLRDDVKAGTPSDPYLFSGYDHRIIHLTHGAASAVTFQLEVDRKGDGTWTALRAIPVPAAGGVSYIFNNAETGAWIRLTADRDAEKVSAHFQYRNRDPRTVKAAPCFNGIATAQTARAIGGIMRGLGNNRRTLGLVAVDMQTGEDLGYYELDAELKLSREDTQTDRGQVIDAASPANVFEVDAASTILIEDGKRYRIPANLEYSEPKPAGSLNTLRVCREVATERDLFNCQGTFYELPARNAQGFAKIRPVASHNFVIHDYCSYRGLMLLTGLAPAALGAGNEHIIVSDDGKAALWAGVIDDLWKLGKPVGEGGPWKDTAVTADTPSDPYLMTAYDKKTLTLQADAGVSVRVEVDIDGTGLWIPYQTFLLEPGKALIHEFPEGFSAYWVRTLADKACTATAQFKYE